MVTAERKLTHCPHCRAEVLSSAKMCRYCGDNVTRSAKTDPHAISKEERRQAGWIVAVAFVLGLVAVVLIHRSFSTGDGRSVAPLQQVHHLK